ncbi:isopeptide-forming domain-containing fimbrial protein [Streptomyces sp. NBC_00237]|uniref:DUF7927 domain-containing protein n=1 Tax=Streptomyces sp. NBC_00237 TaxID=2975687 RepID=UPI00224E4F28|nr:isopeptide-forming domain-containing fimbrial protein [Streptomyces sp. NBC_00237]MCX5201436.1 isopeptide-forming domain-containing fimbrial protein [Streptomyces sp. NBC_00237]
MVTVGVATLMSGVNAPAFAAGRPAPGGERAAFADTVDFGEAPTASLSDFNRGTFPCGGYINQGPSTDEVIATWSGRSGFWGGGACPANNVGDQSAIGFKPSVKQVEDVETDFQMAEVSRYNNVIQGSSSNPQVTGKLHLFLQKKDVVCTWKVIETDNRPGDVPDPVTIDCGGTIEPFTSANGKKYELDLRGFREGTRDGSGKVTCSPSNPLIQTWQTLERSTTGACLFARLVGVPQQLEVKKTVDKATAQYGDVVTYTVTGTNTGTADLKPAKITDDMTKVMDAAEITGVQSATVDGQPVDPPTYDDATKKLTWSGDLAVGKKVEITYRVRTKKLAGTDNQLDNVITAPDSNCANGTANDCKTNTKITEVPLKVKKAVSKTTAEAGDVVTYTVEVENPGNKRDEVEVVDDMTAVLDAADIDGTPSATVNGAAAAAPVFDAAAKKLTWKGPMDAGAKLVLTYNVKVKNPLAGDKKLNNVVKVEGSNCEAGTAPECTTQVTTIETPLKVKKTVGQKVAGARNTVEYTIVVENPGAARNPVNVTDDLTQVLDAATLRGAPTATINGRAVSPSPVYDPATKKLTWTGPLGRNEKLEIAYRVQTPRAASGDKQLDNGVTVPDSNCANPAADPQCRTTVPIADVTMTKTGRPAQPRVGQKYFYTIVLSNTGKVDLVGGARLRATDDLRDVLDDANYNNDAKVQSGPAGRLTFTGGANASLKWEGDLRVGETVTIVYSVTVKRQNLGNMELNNTLTSVYDLSSVRGAVRRAEEDGENAGHCENGDPRCDTNTGIAYLNTVKTASPAKVKPGETVTYTWSLKNSGKAEVAGDPDFDYVVDAIPGVLKYADYNDDIKVVEGPGAVSFADGKLKWTGPLKVGEKAVVTFSVTVRKDALKGLPKNKGAMMTNTVNTEYNCWPGQPERAAGEGVLGHGGDRPAGRRRPARSAGS